MILINQVFKPNRIRIYKLSTFDALTDEERKAHKAYKESAKADSKAYLKQKRDELIASFEGVRQIGKAALHPCEFDESGQLIPTENEERTDNQIALFESEMARYATDFPEKAPLLTEIVYLKVAQQNTILKQILEHGVDIDGTHYIFYSSTTNQMKRGEIILIQEDFYRNHQQQFMCGLTDELINSNGGCNTGKYLAYRGLPLSTSFIPTDYELNIDKCLVVGDFETFLEEEVKCIDHDDNTITDIEIRKELIKIPQTDGAGMFLPGVLPASAQIRCAHMKGCIFPFDFRKFLTQESVEGIKPSPMIKDAWGSVHDVLKEDIQVILTASQLKMWKYYDSWEDYKRAFKENGMRIAINKFADTEPKGYAKSSYQFLQTLDPKKVTAEKITELCQPTIDYLAALKKNPEKIVDLLGDSYLVDAIKADAENMLRDKYVQQQLENKFRSERTDARGCKLILEDSLYSYICPDLYAFCEWLFCGIENPKGLIPRNHVYNSFFNDKQYTKVDCLRSPHLYMEHGIRNLVKGADLEVCREWFNDLDTVVSGHDLLCRVLQFDVDGDEILLTPNQTMMDCVPDGKHTLYYTSFSAEKTPVTPDAIYKALVASMDNSNIGDISNVMTKNYNSPDIDDDFNAVMCCYNNLTIDFPKSQKNISLGEYEAKYTHLKGKKPPYFFIYAKGKKKANCEPPSNSICDRICQHVHKMTGNKQYDKDTQKFDPSRLFRQNITVDVNSEQYHQLETLMFNLKAKASQFEIYIQKEIEKQSKSDGIAEKINRYDVFYQICERMILQIVPDRVTAAQYLLEYEYLQRNETAAKTGKNILWNCFGDVIAENIQQNQITVVKKRRAKYTTSKIIKMNQIERAVMEDVLESDKRTATIYKEELAWIDEQPYKERSYQNDRELLFVLLVLTKSRGNIRIYSNKKTALTFGTIDKMLGDDVSIAKRGIARLEKIGAITTRQETDYLEVQLACEPGGKEVAYEVPNKAKSILPYFYGYNKERAVGKCVICGKPYIKAGKRKTCSAQCSRENELRNKRTKVS